MYILAHANAVQFIRLGAKFFLTYAHTHDDIYVCIPSKIKCKSKLCTKKKYSFT